MNLQTSLVVRAAIFVFFGLVLCGIVFEFAGYSAMLMFRSIAEGAFLHPGAWKQSLRWAMPLFITAVGVAISFRCGYFNIGAQGQLYMGALGATFTAYFLNGASPWILVPSSFFVGAACGALWAWWPGILRIKWGADEVITTLMGNFIATLLLIYFTSGILKDPSGTGQVSSSKPLAAAYRISTSVGVSWPIIAMTVLTGVAAWLLVNKTSYGVLSSIAGRNPVMIVWQGGKLNRLGLAAFILSGALAGISGAIEVFGPNGRLVSGFLPTHGFTAILIALVANLSITAIAFVALFFGGLASAALYLPVLAGLPAAAIDIINASIALFITAKADVLKFFSKPLRALRWKT